MSITINPNSTNDSAFIELVARIVNKLDEDYDPEQVFIIEIKNWFDHNWLKFSGSGRVAFDHFSSSHPQVALDEFFQDKITFPPFTPNRVLREERWTRGTSERWNLVHRGQHSSSNLHRRVTQFAGSALFVWFSFGTQSNDRASLMVYRVDGESVVTWYASLRKEADWKLDRTKGIEREAVQILMDTIAESDASAPPASVS